MKKELTREEKIEKLVRSRLCLIKAQEKNRLNRCVKQVEKFVEEKKQGKTL